MNKINELIGILEEQLRFIKMTVTEREYLENTINKLKKAINYTRCCKSDSEQLKCEHKYGQLKNGTYTCFDCGHKEEW